MIPVLISACLLNLPVRYNGKALPLHDPLISLWRSQKRLLPFCPEVAAGLPTPRPPAEIIAGDGAAVLEGGAQVLDSQGQNLTTVFFQGAQQALALAQKSGARLAILTEKSPSCGSQQIYNGQFKGQLQSGMGVTSALLEAHGIRVFNQHQLNAAADYLKQLEQALPAHPHGSKSITEQPQ